MLKELSNEPQQPSESWIYLEWFEIILVALLLKKSSSDPNSLTKGIAPLSSREHILNSPVGYCFVAYALQRFRYSCTL